MPKTITPLTDTQVRNAKTKDKTYRLFDGGGLYLEVSASGSKLWRMKFRQANGKESRLAFGAYPEVTLADARSKRDEAKKQKATGVDPGQARRIAKLERAVANANTFEAVARDWHQNKIESWQPRTAKNVLHRLEKDVFPYIGSYPITEIKAPLMLDVLRQIEKRGAVDMAKRQSQPFPIKIGMTLDDVDARVSQQCKGSAMFDNPVILGRWPVKRVGFAESAIHYVLRSRGTWRENIPSKEWFNTTIAEVESIVAFAQG